MEIIIRGIPNDYSYKHKYLEKYSDSINVIALGNSHVFYGIDPQYFKENTFNAAHVSQSLNYDYSILQKYKDNWHSLKCVIIPIDYFSLYTTLKSGTESWRVKNYSIYYGIYRSKKLEDNFEIFNGKLSTKLSRIYDFIRQKPSITCDSLGWGTAYQYSGAKDLSTSGMEAALRHKRDNDYEKYFIENMETLKSIISFAKDKNIRVVFITYPAYKTYREYLDPNQLNTSINAITQLTLNNSNTYYYNLLDNEAFDKTDFFDADHLNENGTKKISLMVDSLIKT